MVFYIRLSGFSTGILSDIGGVITEDCVETIIGGHGGMSTMKVFKSRFSEVPSGACTYLMIFQKLIIHHIQKPQYM